MLNQKSGMTLLEIMTVIVIAGIIFSIGYFIMTKAGDDFRLKSGTRSLRSDIVLARQYAKEKGNDYGIRFQDKTWEVFYIDNVGDTLVESSFDMPHNIKLGVLSDVNAKVSGTGSPPADGIDFPSKFIFFMQRQAVPGAIYMNNGRQTKAVEINILGNTRIYNWKGSSWSLED